jgi:hypothetical protein
LLPPTFFRGAFVISPTVFLHKGYRFFFYSREEDRKHIHVISLTGESKFWLEPSPELVKNRGHSDRQLKQIKMVIEEHLYEFISAWNRHFDLGADECF